MKSSASKIFNEKLMIKKCHICGFIMESRSEVKKCKKCNKSFLPTNYFGKKKALNIKEFQEMFSSTDEIYEEDLIKGIPVLW